MPTQRPPELDAEHRLAAHKLFEAVFAFAWRALDRHGLPTADRDDIAQNVAIAALRRWPSYREGSGSPGQWIWGIVRNEYRAFRRAQLRQPVLVGDDLVEVPSEAPDPEESASLHDLADHLLSALPIDQRRVVMLYEIVGLTYREIAALEGISKSEAHERHRTGLPALAAGADRGGAGRLRGVALLPMSLAEMGGGEGEGGADPPAQVRDDAWQRATAELGLVAPPSPAWDGGQSPSSRPPRPAWSWLRRLAPTGVALLGGSRRGRRSSGARRAWVTMEGPRPAHTPRASPAALGLEMGGPRLPRAPRVATWGRSSRSPLPGARAHGARGRGRGWGRGTTTRSCARSRR